MSTQIKTIKPAIQERLVMLAQHDQQSGITSKFNDDHERVNNCAFDVAGLHIDFSKTHLSQTLLAQYIEFAQDRSFEEARHALFSGERINATEDRAVLHTLLRDATNQGIATQEAESLQQAQASEALFYKQYNEIQSQLSARKIPVTDIIHVGIGGSSLGTQLVFEALVDVGAKIRVHFIGNIDAHQLVSVLDQCKAESTLVIGVSKTFTTAETLQNIRSLGQWYQQHGIENWLQQTYAVTAAPQSADQFGIPKNNIVTFPTWVGGRYSVWSSVSLSAVLVLGIDKFKAFLAGAASIDQHFYQTPLQNNVCFIAAALDHYYGNFLQAKSRAIFAYDYRLRSLVDYLQQLETESNGKDRQRDGSKVDQMTSPVVWGGVGTDVQHSVFQMLHQGTSLIPAEFILVKTADHDLEEHHNELLANGLAQTAALLAGQTLDTVKQLNEGQGLPDITLKAKIFAGEKPSTTILLEQLTPHALGALLAFYEHRTFCGGVFANINSYDQMGVELGKRLAKQVKPLLEGEGSAESLDASTANLLKRIKS